jgi:radical SAM protein with 4Fe4S-binding SPASM domain
MTAPALPTISYGELTDRIQRGNARARIPLAGSWELTFRCNLQCGHCWVNLPAADRAARTRELTVEEIRRITDEVVEAGCLWLLLTGGEVFIRPDFFEIYTYKKRAGLMLTVFTNGTTITERVADLLAEWPPRRIEISLYGITPKTYAAVTGVPALERCLRGIRLLLDRKLNLRLKSVVTTENYDEYLAIRRFVQRELGLREFSYDPNLNYRKVEGRAGFAPARHRVPPEKIVELDRTLDQDTGDGLRNFYQNAGPVKSSYVFTCGAGMNSFHIDPYGQLSTCMMVPSHTYDLRQGSFRQGWEEYFPSVVYRKREKSSRCHTCSIASACDNCPGWSVLEHGEFEHPNDYLCELNHRRAEVFEAPALLTLTPKEPTYA